MLPVHARVAAATFIVELLITCVLPAHARVAAVDVLHKAVLANLATLSHATARFVARSWWSRTATQLIL